jgi:hypothetical protein
MSPLMDEALSAVEGLQDADDDELFRQLGLRMRAMERDPKLAGHFAPPAAALEPMGMTLGDIITAGRHAFATLSKASYALLCSSGSAGGRFDAFVDTLGTNRMAITAALATVLVAQIGIAPAIAGVVATLAIGKAAPASMEIMCTMWAGKAGIEPSAAPEPATQPTMS